MENFEELFSELFLLEDPMDKYEWIIDYGKGAYGVGANNKLPENLVSGCTSSLWLVKLQNGHFACESDSSIVNGFSNMICDYYNQATVHNKEKFSLDTLVNVGLAPLLSMGRQNGIANLIAKLKNYE